MFIVAGGLGRYTRTSVPAPYRYPWIQPFSADSYANKGIGSNAVYGPTNDGVYAGLQYAINFAGSLYVQPPSNPYNAPFYYSTNTGDPTYTCISAPLPNNQWEAAQPGYQSAMHLPSSAQSSSSADSILQLMDTANPTELWGWNNGININTSQRTISGSGSYWDTRGNGCCYSGQGACNLIGWRAIDAQTASINRVLPCSMPPPAQYAWEPNDGQDWGLGYNCTWPYQASDYWLTQQGNNYNTTAGVPNGSIIFIPKAVFTITNSSMASLLGHSPSALEMAAAMQLQNYGLLVQNISSGFVVESSWDWNNTYAGVVDNVYTKLQGYLRVMGSWIYAPGLYGLLGRGQTPPYAPGAGYQYDPRFNPNAPINGGGTYPAPPGDFDPALGIGNGRTYKTSGVRNGWGAV